MIARWTARIFPDNKSNPVIDEHFVIADRGVVFARDVVERGVAVVSECRHGVSVVVGVIVVRERRHGVIDTRHGVVVTLGIDVRNGSSPTKLSVVVVTFTEREPSGPCSMSSSASSMASSPERGVAVIVTTAQQ